MTQTKIKNDIYNKENIYILDNTKEKIKSHRTIKEALTDICERPLKEITTNRNYNFFSSHYDLDDSVKVALCRALTYKALHGDTTTLKIIRDIIEPKAQEHQEIDAETRARVDALIEKELNKNIN